MSTFGMETERRHWTLHLAWGRLMSYGSLSSMVQIPTSKIIMVGILCTSYHKMGTSTSCDYWSTQAYLSIFETGLKRHHWPWRLGRGKPRLFASSSSEVPTLTCGTTGAGHHYTLPQDSDI